jgi:hypothetical protein
VHVVHTNFRIFHEPKQLFQKWDAENLKLHLINLKKNLFFDSVMLQSHNISFFVKIALIPYHSVNSSILLRYAASSKLEIRTIHHPSERVSIAPPPISLFDLGLIEQNSSPYNRVKFDTCHFFRILRDIFPGGVKESRSYGR